MIANMKKSMSERLAGIVLPDAEGNQIRLGSLWESQPAVIVFLRHYG
jgi:hypothetical protein